MRDATVRRDTVMNSFERDYPELNKLATANGMTFVDDSLLRVYIDGRFVWSFSSSQSAEWFVRGFLFGRGVL